MKPWAVILSLVHNAVGIMTPFLLAATGGLYTELSGMLNIALEGLMLIGAFFGVVFAGLTGSLALGVLLGIASSLAAGLLFGLVTLNLKANVFIAGLATNLLASGLTVVLAFQLFKNKGVVRFELGSLPTLALPAGIEAHMLTQDKAIQAAWERDPLIVRVATAGWWLGRRGSRGHSSLQKKH